MKSKNFKKAFCMILTVLMASGIIPLKNLKVSAEGMYDAAISITPPRLGNLPSAAKITEPSLTYEVLSYYWEDSCCDKMMKSDPSGLIEWMESIEGKSIDENGVFTKFENGHEYRL